MKAWLRIIVFLITVSANGMAYGNTPDTSYSKIDQLNDLIKKDYYSADLYFNLGNEYFIIKDYPHAVLYYEKALKLDPYDNQITHNLFVVNRKIDSEIVQLLDFFPLKWWKAFILFFLPETWAFFTIIAALIIVLLSIIRWYFKRNFNKIWIWVASIIFIVFLITAFNRNSVLYSDKNVIIMSSRNIYSSPDEKSEKLYTLPAGEKLIITDSLKGWYEVRLKNKEKGWIRKDKIERI